MNAAPKAHNPLSAERQLLSFSLEMSAAPDNLSAAEAFSRYLRGRFQPARLTQVEFAVSHSNLFSGKQVFKADDSTLHFFFAGPSPLVISLENCSEQNPSPEEIALITQILNCYHHRAEVVAELKGLTYTDDLTGLYNQRYLELTLDRELSLAKRNNTQFSVLFLDLDHFKAVNDTHGHLIGSRLLFEVGQEIKKALRESDITFRYGGDEFVMILAHTDLEAALFVAERIRVQIEKKRFLARDNMDIRLTASIGVASVPLHAVTKQQILKAADEALYGVKKAVRNRVIAATAKPCYEPVAKPGNEPVAKPNSEEEEK
jgi:diguanylate cyclase (GGDEF)-like protein